MELDLHVHSDASFDCDTTPAEIIARALEAGLGGIAVADHDSMENLETLQELAAGRLLVIPAIEVGTLFGDVVGYFAKKRVERNIPEEGQDVDDLKIVLKALKGQGALLSLPHPTRGQLATLIETGLWREFDLVEAYNARRHEFSNLEEFGGEPFVLDFAERYEIGKVAGSDAHIPSDIGIGRTVVPAETLEDVRRALEAGTTVLAGRKAGWMSRIFGRLRHPQVEEKEPFDEELD